jgi:hypothetical protein
MQIDASYIATRDETVEAILQASKRPSQRAPLRRTFLQQRVAGAERVRPGPLAKIVKNGHESALDQYLLLAAWSSGRDENGLYGVRRPASLWARALGLADDARGRQQVSRNWKLLSDLKLVHTKTKARQVRASLLLEDGSGLAYVPPASAYLGLSYAYWRNGWHEDLDLPAKAMLLIFLTLEPKSPLPFNRVPEWYGISKATADRGTRTLRRRDLLEAIQEPIKMPLAPKGYSVRNVYTLAGDFRLRQRPKSGDAS